MAPDKKRKREKDVTVGAPKPKAVEKSVAESPKKRTRTTNAPPPQSTLTRSKDEETSFPRGGAQVLTPLEYKEVANEAAKDVLFEAGGVAAGGDDGGNMVKRSKKKHRRTDGKKGKKVDETLEKKDQGPKVEGFSYKRLIPGTLVLGCVERINKTDIALSLPNNLTGYVPITAISEKITDKLEALAEEEVNSDDEEESGDDEEKEEVDISPMFRVGQYLRAYVLQTAEESSSDKSGQPKKRKKRIELSLLPKLANSGLAASDLAIGCTLQASVTSVEDHGLVMDLGLDGDVKGFLSSKELGTGLTITSAKEGQALLCTVTGLSSNGKIVKLSADLEQKFSKKGKLSGGKGSWWLSEAPTVDAFLPGTGAEILVTEVGKQGGVVGKIMGMLDAVADFFHVAGWETDLEQKIKPGSKIKARITSTFPDSDPKKVSFSVLPHILSFVPASETDPLVALPIATRIDSAKVIGVESRVGLFLDVGVPNISGFVHISRISSEEKVDELPKDTGPYKIGTIRPARILGFNPMDGLYIVSMEKRVLDQRFIRIEDIKVGEVVKGKVEKILDRGGLIVNVSDGISGIVEEEHVSDVKLKNPEKKFRVGTEVRARVLATSNLRKKLRLTLKKTLVNSDAPIISSYEVEPGMQSVGTLVNVMPNGAVVRFYSGVSAYLPVSEMSEAYIQDPREHFRVGQSVNVHVLSVDPEERRMRVSCKDPNAFGEAQKKALLDLKPGQLISGKISEKSDNDLVLELEGLSTSGLKGVLMVGQLTDGSREKNASTMRKLRAGQTLNDLVVLDTNERRRMIYLSLKPSLVKAAKEGTIITAFDDINEGMTLKGFVNNTSEIGVFISFASGITGLALRSAIPAEVLSLPGFGYVKHQSITAKVISVDRDQKKFLLSLKSRDDKPTKESSGPVDSKAVENPVDKTTKSISEYTTGKLTKARIISVQETQINVQLADGVQGRIDVSQLFDSWEDIKNRRKPLEGFKRGTILDVRVIGIHDARNHRFLAITHRVSHKKSPIFELSAKPSDVKSEKYEMLTLDKVVIGSQRLAFVNGITPDCIWVNISPDIRGRVQLLDLSDDVAQLRDVEKHFPIGSALRCHAVNIDLDHRKLDLSVKSASVQKLDLEGLAKGMVVPGRVTKVMDRQVLVHVSDSVAGIVNITDVADDFDQAKPSQFKQGDVVRVCVLDVDKPNKRVNLSTRPSRVLDSNLPVKDPEVHNIRDVKEQELRRGFVKNVSDKGLFVTLAPNVTAWVKVADLSDTFLKEWKSNFQVDQVVQGRIIAVDPPLGHIQMSLRPSAITGKVERQTGLSDLKKGQIVTGKIKKIAEYGVFVSIDGTNISGLCHKSQIADRKIGPEDISKLYSEGDAVKAKILDVDLEKKRISFGLKASYVLGADKDSDSDSDDGGMAVDDDDDEAESSDDGGVDLSRVRDLEQDDSDSDDDDDASDISMEDAPPTEGLSVGGFDWNADIFSKRTHDEASGSDSEGEKKSRTRKKRRSEVQADLTGEMISRDPQSATDFERLVLGDPNDSRLWIQYMAFQLQLGELEKAREIAERALKTIAQREDAEKRNVWVAMLNMENSYGDDESIEELFKRAVQYNDARDIHQRLASIYILSGKTDKADTLFKSMVKKFSQNPEVWHNYNTFLLSNNNRSAARELLKRALQALPTNLHRDLIIKSATAEFRTGDAERGRTLFENLIGAYNKRMDIWNVFLDLEISHGGAGREEAVRSLFKRAIGDEKCGARQASGLFRKWKAFEERHGSERTLKDVAERARVYVERQKAARA